MSSRQPSPGQLSQNASQVGRLQFKAKQPHIGGGLAQESDNMKYMAKYKELKRKVRETELDNDKLHYKVLQAKRNIQRMKLERAILYERLAAVPPSPELHDRQPLPSQPYHPQPTMDAEPGFVDYMRSHPTHRGGPAPEVINDPYLRSSRRESATDARLMAPMQPPSSHTRSHSHASPPGAKYSTSRPMYDRMPYPENLPPVQHVLHSTPDRDRGRRQDLHDLSIPTHSHSSSLGPLSPPSDSRSTSSRTHNHQRIGPGTYVNRDDHRERTREIDLEREREWDMQRERRDIPVSRTRDMPSSVAHMRSPPNAHRYYHDMAGASASAAPGYTMHSRSETPGSGSGGSGSGPPMPGGGELPSRPDSPTAAGRFRLCA
ncbi:hypothetical protein CPB85DRAFT_425122 [Mucidula mucida]|nr:hypothetical protein CPB85DRAFT_425122 [Mucidula mucida]